MNKKYERYINYIVNDIQPPYFKNMENEYGLRSDEYPLILSKVFDQPVKVDGSYIYDSNNNIIYQEYSDGGWYKQEYDINGNRIYHENSNGYWERKEYNQNSKLIYQEYSDGFWSKYEYDQNGNEVYYEDSNGFIEDNR